ncbi:PREDICTED: uncharacterized protein LOC109588527 [Amphimedon queenslandica]|uniref:Uncharacterized protein n=1 Tax=Amphimedon queenslandica TaxID=400682 RepID=A0AAN0JTK9_AMPQE|nr:PREDICTED: uncharacterized protein LOC109588527 [Amphimedon queenslandica]|eukprot:XP_019860238.1 PREDICTED: uncharacterized protein LOC109588527 [Amphimedon queenslandica]
MEERTQLRPDRPRLNMAEVLKTLHDCTSKCSVFTVIDGYGSVIANSSATDDLDDVNLPKQLYHLKDPDYSKLSASELDCKVLSTFDEIKVTPAESDFLEQSTRNQSNSYLWLEHRRGLITASHFHSVLHYSGRTFPSTIIKAIMQYSSPNPEIPTDYLVSGGRGSDWQLMRV